MSALIRALQYATTTGFCLLALASVWRWRSVRDRVRAYLALAISLLALVALLGQAGRLTDYRYGILFDVSLVAFLASGYFLLMFRHEFLPLSRASRVVSAVAVAGLGAAAIAARLPYEESPEYSSGQNLLILGIVAAWMLCVGEPIVRFWRASKQRPAVQRARLRALSLAYGGIVAILVVSVTVHPERSSALAVAIQILTLLLIPLLLVSFAPPRWLRRVWRGGRRMTSSSLTIC
ncbi:MAG: hypothetical protein ABR529_16030 [Actinomycetota bacterium]